MYQPSPLADLLPSKPTYLPEPDAVGRTLLAAAHLIRTHGLAKNVPRSARGELCLGGAIGVAMNGYPDTAWLDEYGQRCCKRTAASLTRAFPELMSKAHGYGNWSIPVNFNNAPERTADEVIAALEDAAFYREPAVG